MKSGYFSGICAGKTVKKFSTFFRQSFDIINIVESVENFFDRKRPFFNTFLQAFDKFSTLRHAAVYGYLKARPKRVN